MRTGAEIIKGCDAAFAAAPAMTVPLFIVHGGADQVCPIEGSRRLAALLPPPRAELHEYAESYHELLNEPAFAAAATERIVAWLDSRVVLCAASASSSATGSGSSPHV